MKFYTIFLIIFVASFGKGIFGKNEGKGMKNMKIIVAEPEEDIPRKELVEILQNKQYFQDIISEHVAPLEFQFGHVFENPKEWEQRFERVDMKNREFQGKVRWGNKDGSYGEHYWDLNH